MREASVADEIGKLISEFRAKRWNSQPFERVVAFIEANRENAVPLVERFFTELKTGDTFVAFAIGNLPEAAFPDLAKQAIAAIRADPKNESASEFIAQASLQSPTSLHRWLRDIFDLKPNWETYYALWPWRESGVAEIPFLRDIANSRPATEKPAVGRRPRTPPATALEALCETRHPQALEYVQVFLGEQAADQLEAVGFEWKENGPRRLYEAECLHLCFPAGHFDDGDAPVHRVKRNPTWSLEDREATRQRFGGKGQNSCAKCGGVLHHLLTILPVPAVLGVTGLASLSLETCLSCLCWARDADILFYRHDAAGVPTQVPRSGGKQRPEFPASGLAECQVWLAMTPRRWRWQDWALSNGRQNLNRVGGHPAWIQSAHYPPCPSCSRKMHHLLQLDSDLPTKDRAEWLWGSGGCCYVAWCDECKISGFHWQCT